jgi:hypothetical protein
MRQAPNRAGGESRDWLANLHQGENSSDRASLLFLIFVCNALGRGAIIIRA